MEYDTIMPFVELNVEMMFKMNHNILQVHILHNEQNLIL